MHATGTEFADLDVTGSEATISSQKAPGGSSDDCCLLYTSPSPRD